MKTHSLLAALFINSNNDTIESWQLLDEENIAVAIADFRNGVLDRFECSNRTSKYLANKWKNEIETKYKSLSYVIQN